MLPFDLKKFRLAQKIVKKYKKVANKKKGEPIRVVKVIGKRFWRNSTQIQLKWSGTPACTWVPLRKANKYLDLYLAYEKKIASKSEPYEVILHSASPSPERSVSPSASECSMCDEEQSVSPASSQCSICDEERSVSPASSDNSIRDEEPNPMMEYVSSDDEDNAPLSEYSSSGSSDHEEETNSEDEDIGSAWTI